MKQFIELPEDNLWGAARTDDLDGIKKYLSEGAEINELSPETNLSPLAWATMMGHTKAADLLIESGADLNVRQEDGGTPLHIAAALGRAELAELLIKKGADVNAKNRRGDVPASGLYVPWGMLKFMIGMFDIKVEEKEVKAGRAKIAKMLNVKFESQQRRAATSVWDAAFIGDVDMVKKAVSDGMDVNARNPESGDPLLFTASLMGHTDIVSFLLEKGADINVKNRDGNSSLHAAAFLGRAGSVEVLLKHGIDVHSRNNSGGTAMDNANLDWDTTQAILNMIQVIEVKKAEVLAGRAKIKRLLTGQMKDVPQSHNLWKASANGNLASIKSALDSSSDLNALDPQFGLPPLGWASINGKTDAVKLLLKKGADINHKHRDGSTALHSAAFLGHVETVKLLLEKGANINAQSNDGSLPINAAQLDWGLTKLVVGILQLKVDEAKVKAGRVKVVELLSSQGK